MSVNIIPPIRENNKIKYLSKTDFFRDFRGYLRFSNELEAVFHSPPLVEKNSHISQSK